MNFITEYLIIIVSCFLIGSIPFGVIVSKLFFGFDIRDKGSGNIGSTNVFRVLGKKWGIVVQILDIAKAFFAVVLLADVFMKSQVGETYFYDNQLIIELIAGISAVLGHIFSVFLKFKGGKGVSSIAGILFAIAPFDFSFTMLCFFLLIFTTGYVSLGAILGGISFPIVIYVRKNFFDAQYNNYEALLILACFLSSVIILTHISNIKRLLKGEENGFESLKILRFGRKKQNNDENSESDEGNDNTDSK